MASGQRRERVDRGRERRGGVADVGAQTHVRPNPRHGRPDLRSLDSGAMAPVTVLILAPEPARDAGPLERTLDAARAALAEHHRRGFLDAGAETVVVRREPPDDTPFGARLRRLVAELRPDGLVVLGAGSIPLATAADLAAFVEAAAADVPGALANHRYSADVVAIARAGEVLRDLPDLASDNALPRWLAEVAAIPRPRPRDEAAAGDGRRLAAGPAC